MATVVIYKNTLEGRVPVARLVQDERGHTEFVPGEDPAAFDRMVAMFGASFWSKVSNVEVTPDDGDEFFKAVFAELANSTYLSAAFETPAELGKTDPQLEPALDAPSLVKATADQPDIVPPVRAPDSGPAPPPTSAPTGIRGWLARRRSRSQ